MVSPRQKRFHTTEGGAWSASAEPTAARAGSSYRARGSNPNMLRVGASSETPGPGGSRSSKIVRGRGKAFQEFRHQWRVASNTPNHTARYPNVTLATILISPIHGPPSRMAL